MISGTSSQDFELSAIRAFYESDTNPQSKLYDGSKTSQNGCNSVKITYKGGRSDNYKITEFTEESLTLVFQNSTDNNLPNTSAADSFEIHRINAQTYETKFFSTLGLCDNAEEGTIEVSETTSWANPLPTVPVSPDFMAKVQKAQTNQDPACFNSVQNAQ